MPAVRNWHLGAALLALTIVAYWPLWHNDFIDFDDEQYITDNRHVTGGISARNFGWAWSTFHGIYWQPISWLSLQLDAHLFSTYSATGEPIPSPAAFHGQSLFWHAASTLLLFGLLNRLGAGRWRSFLVAALFAVHPLHVESVAWAAERKDVLSVFFGLLAVWAYVSYAAAPGWRRYAVVVGAFALSLLSKPMLLTLPFALLLLDYWPLRRLWPDPPADSAERTAVPPLRLVLEKVPLLVLATAIGFLTFQGRVQAGSVTPLQVLPLSARLANAATAYGWYVAHTFFPGGLAVLYPHPHGNWAILPVVAGVGLLLGVTLLACWQARRRRWLIVGWLWFVGSLVPVIGLAQGGEQAWADRFSYWPHIGLFVAIVWGLAEGVERFRIPVAVSGAAAALGLGGLALLTWNQVGYWHDTLTLWEHALAVTEGNYVAHVHCGERHLKQSRPDLAERHCAEAVRILPGSPQICFALGQALLTLGKNDEAAVQFRDAVQSDPANADTWQNLGVSRLRQGRPTQALRSFRKVLELQPDSADALGGLGHALWRTGQCDEAVRSFQAALEHNHNSADAWNGLGVAYLTQGNLEEANEAFVRAGRLNPQLVSACSNRGVALARQGRWADAVTCHSAAVAMQEQAEKVLRAMQGRPPAMDGIPQIVIYQCRLAFALEHYGDHRGAVAVYRSALERDPDWPTKFTARAWALATDADNNFRDPRLAYELATQAAQATGDPPAATLDALAAAAAALGEFPQAIQAAQQALKKAPAAPEQPLYRSRQVHLHLYQEGKCLSLAIPKELP
jgi:tetratricopeptide (TPR) repeat protein